jgi:MSHA biogenesis protein MshN
MLQDLEARKHAPLGAPAARPLFGDMHAVVLPARRRWLPVALLSGVVLLGVAVGYLLWQRGVGHVPATAAVAAPPPAAPERVAQPPVTASGRNVVNPATLPAARAVEVSGTQGESAVPEPATARAAMPSVDRFATVAAADASSTPAAPVTAAAVMEKKPIVLTPAQAADAAYRAAARDWQQGRADAAEQGLTQALSLDPRHIGARELLASVLLQRGRLDQAQHVMEQGLESLPANAGFTLLLARIHAERKNDTQAIALLEPQRSRTPPDAEAQALLAALYQRNARHAEAVAAYRDALDLRPLEGKWWLGLGISEEAQEHWSEATQAYERARSSNIEPRLGRYAEERLRVVRAK